MIYLALRREPATGSPWYMRAMASLIRWRLVSRWSHAGVVCDGVLHHVTVPDGLTSTDDWTPSRWDLYPLPDECKAALQVTLRRYAGAKYDWFSLLAFILPGRHWRDSSRLYCFELPAEVLGMSVKRRIAPERLLDMTLHLIKVAK